MKRSIEGEDRYQSTLFPERLADSIAEDNSVRVIEAFVQELDLQSLGFESMQTELTSRASYHPSTRSRPRSVEPLVRGNTDGLYGPVSHGSTRTWRSRPASK